MRCVFEVIVSFVCVTSQLETELRSVPFQFHLNSLGELKITKLFLGEVYPLSTFQALISFRTEMCFPLNVLDGFPPKSIKETLKSGGCVGVLK